MSTIKKSLLLLSFVLLPSVTLLCMDYEANRLFLFIALWHGKKEEIKKYQIEANRNKQPIEVTMQEFVTTFHPNDLIEFKSVTLGKDTISYDGLYKYIGDDSNKSQKEEVVGDLVLERPKEKKSRCIAS
jgi:hypothetical protein